MAGRLLLTIASVAAATVLAAPATQAAAGGLTPARSCAEMARADVSEHVGAQTTIASASLARSPKGYEYCAIKGNIAPQIQFELQLPTTTYGERYLQTGCGGLCGNLSVNAQAANGCAPLDNGTFAMASNNLGHVGTSSSDGSFGSDPRLRVDFAYRADHLTAVASKALIKRFYGKRPRFSYFDGCSQGGHQGLTEAQRYPDDFDGVLAGAPASITQALNAFYQPWMAAINTGANRQPILTPGKLPALHWAALAACDDIDGLEDGLIDDPRACHFDPASLRCPAGQDAAGCLTAAQVGVVRKAYSGPVTSRGDHLYPGGQQPGSELAWTPWLVPASGQTMESTSAWGIGTNWLRYLAFPRNPAPDFSPLDQPFTRRAFRRADRLAGLYDATNPDLSEFKRRGGRLILWHGWADQAISPEGTVAYYRAIQDRMDGAHATKAFARLFMFPGMLHCRGGDAPNTFDLLTPLVDWVENRSAPSKVVASQSGADGQVIRTRPSFAYPKVARYDGSGSPNDAANFKPARPARPSRDRFHWLGSFEPGRELWCDATGRCSR